MGTGRARSKHTPRGIGAPNTPEGDSIGASDRMSSEPSPIPGGRVHLENAVVTRQRTPVPDSPPEIKDLNAHGVQPEDHTARERAEFMRGPNDVRPIVPRYDAPAAEPVPVPVRVVQQRSPVIVRFAAPHSFALQASTGEPVRLCGQDPNRVDILILNESSSSDIRFATRQAELTAGNGALLPWPGNSYLRLTTQDELWAISADSGTPRVSVIQTFEQPW
jgi:hypothetical protein